MAGLDAVALYGVYLAGVFSKSVAKEAGKGVGRRLADALSRPPSDIIGKAVRSLGSSETPDVWREDNLRALGKRVQRIATRRGIRPRQVPLSFLFPLVEEAAKVDDRLLGEMWARLLVAGLADDANQQPMFIRLLRDLAAEDARVLDRAVRWCAKGRSHGIGVSVDRSTESSRAALRLEASGLLVRKTDHQVLGRNNLYLPKGQPPVLPIWEMAPTAIALVFHAAVSRRN